MSKAAKNNPSVYNESSIDVFLGLDSVRNAPQVYIGTPNSDGIFHILCEPIQNSSDECKQPGVKNKYIGIIIDKDEMWVFDGGRGIPVGIHKTTKESTFTTVLTTLSAGGKMRSENSGYTKTFGIHGMGVSLTNALSINFEAWTHREGQWYYQQFSKGKPKSKMQKTKGPTLPYVDNKMARPKCGTVIKFTPDLALFDKGSKLNIKKLEDFLEVNSYLHPQLTYYFMQAKKGMQTFHQPEGLRGYLQNMVTKTEEIQTEGKIFEFHDDDVDIVLQWTNSLDEQLHSFVNGSRTVEGGTHVKAVEKCIKDALDAFKLKKMEFKSEDLRAGMFGAFVVKINQPRFTTQTKEKLSSTEATAVVARSVGPAINKFFSSNKALAKSILNRAHEENNARQDYKINRKMAADLRGTKKGKSTLPADLLLSLTRDPKKRELFLIEGKSAKGTAGKARDKEYQEVLPLRGKVLNVHRATPDKIAKNTPIMDILSSIGYIHEEGKKPTQPRVDKVIFLADADEDGRHINILLTGMMFKMLRPLIDAGKVYSVISSLFTTQIGNKRYYGDSADDLRTKIGSVKAKYNITRIKGWGEISPEQLKEIAFNPKTRKLLRLRTVKGKRATRFLSVVGSDTQFRKSLLGLDRPTTE